MNDKILSISIAAYNVSQYLEKALDSIVNSKYINRIEVFVIDDGGTDESLQIAKNYEMRFPHSINVIHKENGGYGSTVNLSVQLATGKYYKLLDGDDWFDTEGLNSLIEFLISNEADWVLTETVKYKNDIADTSKIGKWAAYDKKVLSVDSIKDNLYVGMWEITIRTEILKSSLRKLPEHFLYTDILYVVYPLPYIQNIGFVSAPVYCYRLGRDGQSVTRESRNKHINEYLELVEIVKNYYSEIKGNALSEVIKQRFFTYYKYQIFNYLLLPLSGTVRKKIIELEKETKNKYKEFYDYAGKESRKINLLRKTHYLAYWFIAKYLNNNW